MCHPITWAVISPSSHPALSCFARLEDSKPTSSASVSWCSQELMNMFQAISHYKPVCFHLRYSWVWGPWGNCLAWLPQSAWVLCDLANVVDLPKKCIIILQANFLGNFLANATTFLCWSKLLPLHFPYGKSTDFSVCEGKAAFTSWGWTGKPNIPTSILLLSSLLSPWVFSQPSPIPGNFSGMWALS